MRGRVVVSAVVLVAALSAGAATRAPAAPAPTPLLVDAREWTLVPSRGVVRAGAVAVQLHNGGEDDHDLRLRRLDRRGRPSGRTWRVPLAHPGDVTAATVRLQAGRWRLWCSLAGHAEAGMQVVLRAR